VRHWELTVFKRILVPLDGTPGASAALPAARTLARATDAAVSLVRVTELTPDADRHRQQMADAQKATSAVSDELMRSGLRVETLIRTGDPAQEICEAARAAGADVIVMATHGRSGVQRAFAGSVTERVIGSSPVPVVVLKPGGKRMASLNKMLVALDGTPGGALALGSAVGLAGAAHAEVMLVQVVPPLPIWMYGGLDGFAPAAFIDPAWQEAAVNSAAAYVDALATRLRAAGVQAGGKAIAGPVAERIEAVAEESDVDLIVMSTHALTGPARAVLGSVADEVVRNSHRPVLLVRRPGGVVEAAMPADAQPIT
jgi:nucleotide-binding universal stress UspA family protein